ncbi:DUF4823 domain-containing protein [Simiduia aestuariiviva]|uniref:DUF4823 domain-containing protein n=1 Tax=Simiduia aestuariiviva TaxID=1510459 RepID=A0A839UKJ2_9GAMM|nr:DUF4823 domain-containing protein [Simiduia aestuariiviva]MBB3168153.1 hypothetical protein [Simiduia aestuariiviva]
MLHLRFLVMLAPLWLAACTFNHTVNTAHDLLADLQMVERHSVQGTRAWVAPRNSAWFVAVPNSGPEPEVDRALSQHLAAALRQQFATVLLASSATNPADAVQHARHNGVNFVIYPQLLFAGDGAYSVTEWAARSPEADFGRDEVGVQLLIFDAYTGQLVDAVMLAVKESWLPGYNGRVDALYSSAFETFAKRYSYQQYEAPR